MRRAQYTLWALTNLTLAPTLFVLFNLGSMIVPGLLVTGLWWLAPILLPAIAVCSANWVVWMFCEGLTSVALAKASKTKPGQLARLHWDRYGPSIVLQTDDPSARRWHRLGGAAALPGWWGFAGAVVATASAGLATAGLWLFAWPWWASMLCGLGWVAGYVWYAREVAKKFS